MEITKLFPHVGLPLGVYSPPDSFSWLFLLVIIVPSASLMGYLIIDVIRGWLLKRRYRRASGLN